MPDFYTTIATSDATSITVRGLSLTEDLVGKRSFTETVYFLVCGRLPTPGQTKVLDACLVTLMEHGWTPTSIIARLAIDSVPEESQVALAAGLLSVGSVFAGTMDGCAKLLVEGLRAGGDLDTYCHAVAERYRQAKEAVPGFGHRVHKPDDPRTPALLAVAREAGAEGSHVDLLLRLGRAVDAVHGRHLTINATGAIAALLLDIGIPLVAMRGVAVISRSGGLLGHIVEESQTRTAREIWRLTRENIPYRPADE
ncbi:citryl-CoA lyase [Microvirga sp. 2TAF3]|uniref:citryl-CoA lyase n=1 Tax=Microvirga sp. 2TAF3 TaxID=3233014 RepID=UPI003F9819AE